MTDQHSEDRIHIISTQSIARDMLAIWHEIYSTPGVEPTERRFLFRAIISIVYRDPKIKILPTIDIDRLVTLERESADADNGNFPGAL